MRQVAFILALPLHGNPCGIVSLAPDPTSLPLSQASLWCREGVRLFDGGASGFVLGHVFSRHSAAPVRKEDIFPTCPTNPFDQARFLLDHFWGAYLFAARDPSNGYWRVMVDPSGLLPVYRKVHDDTLLLSSDPGLFVQCTGVRHRVSYEAIEAHLRRPDFRLRRTCLASIDELVPGALVQTDPSLPVTQLWQAEDFAKRNSRLTFEEHAEELRHISTNVIDHWVQRFGQTLVAASGGVDSSLICAAAHSADHQFGCVSVTTADPSGNEIPYAQAVAEVCEARFVERLYDPLLFDPARSASAGLARPSRRAFLVVLDTVLRDAMVELGAKVVFDGNGGDNLFCFLHSSAPLVDRLRKDGPGPGALATLLDMCRITGCSVPTMLLAATRRLLARGPFDVVPEDNSFLNGSAADVQFLPLTAWPVAGQGKRMGWKDHLMLMMLGQNHIHGVSTPLPRFSPLASQPLVEFCLAVPTWQWAQGGRNRALARHAFSDILPRSVLARTSKAGPDSFILAAFHRNRAVIAERLLDGLLAAARIIDRSAVEHALHIDANQNGAAISRLLDLLEAENWARSWTA